MQRIYHIPSGKGNTLKFTAQSQFAFHHYNLSSSTLIILNMGLKESHNVSTQCLMLKPVVYDSILLLLLLILLSLSQLSSIKFHPMNLPHVSVTSPGETFLKPHHSNRELHRLQSLMHSLKVSITTVNTNFLKCHIKMISKLIN